MRHALGLVLLLILAWPGSARRQSGAPAGAPLRAVVGVAAGAGALKLPEDLLRGRAAATVLVYSVTQGALAALGSRPLARLSAPPIPRPR